MMSRRSALPRASLGQNGPRVSVATVACSSLAERPDKALFIASGRSCNCSGAVSIQELYDAVGALRLAEHGAWGREECEELFAALDMNGNGMVDFPELHAALRRYDPPPLESALEAARRHASEQGQREAAREGRLASMRARRESSRVGGKGVVIKGRAS